MECPGVFPVGMAPPRRSGACLPLSVLRTGPLGPGVWPRGQSPQVPEDALSGGGDAAGQLGEVVWHPSDGTIMALTGLPSPTGCDPGWQGPGARRRSPPTRACQRCRHRALPERCGGWVTVVGGLTRV
jgi:hypothetical protein